MLRDAQRRIDDWISDRPFEVKQLFADIWNDLDRGDKIRYGQIFARAIALGEIRGVQRVSDSKNSRHNRYIKQA